MSDNSIFDEYEQLVRRYREGDKEAFDAIYEKSSRFVYATCLGVLGDPEDAGDAMQETYISVFNNLDSLSDGRNLIGWIKRIAVNKSTDMIRKKKGETYYDDAVASEQIVEGSDDLEDLPDYLIIEKSRRDTVHSLIKSELSDVQYQTVFLHYYDEMSVEDIASVMGCPEGTVKTRLKSSRVLIRKAIEKYEKATGDILHAAGTMPLLPALFASHASELRIPDAAAFIKQALTASSGAGAAAAKTAAGEAAKTASKTVSKEAAQAAAKTAAHTASKAAAAKAGGSASAASAAGAVSAAKAGFLATGLGKGIAAVVAALVLVPAGFGAKYILGKTLDAKDDKENEEEIEETEQSAEAVTIGSSVETTEESFPQVSEQTGIVEITGTSEIKDDESLPEPLVTEPSGPVEVSLNDIPDRQGLQRFVARWGDHNYDHNVIDDNYVLGYLLASESGIGIDFTNFSDDYEQRSDYVDPSGLFAGRPCYRVPEDALLFVEENVLNISQEDMARINANITAEGGDNPRGGYFSDGYLYFTSPFWGDSMSEVVISASTDGEYYYVTTVYYDDLYIENDPSYDPVTEGLRFDYVMEYKTVGEKSFWSILSCGESTAVIDEAQAHRALLPEAYDLPDTGWRAAYIDIANSTVPTDFDNGYHDGSYQELVCDLVLINDDDIPELIISVDVDGFVRYGKLYTFIDGEAVYLRELYGYEACYNTYIPRANRVVTGGGPEQNGAFFFMFVSHMTDDLRSMQHVSYAWSNFDLAAYDNVWEDPNANNGTIRYYRYNGENQPVEISRDEYDAEVPGSEAPLLRGTRSVDSFVQALSW